MSREEVLRLLLVPDGSALEARRPDMSLVRTLANPHHYDIVGCHTVVA